MDTLTFSGIRYFPEREFDRKVTIRAERHEHLRGRNNVTSCRSPTRDLDTRSIKDELKRKRHQEFLRRRSVSPEPSSSKRKERLSGRGSSSLTFSIKHPYSSSKSEALHMRTQHSLSVNGRPAMILTRESNTSDYPTTSNWAALWSDPTTKQVTIQEKKHSSTSRPVTIESSQHWIESMHKRESIIKIQKTSIRKISETEGNHQRLSVKTQNICPQTTFREMSVQTESGLVMVKEADIQKLSDYLQEALWREEAVKKKLVSLQQCSTDLKDSSNTLWTSRCSEDLLRNKIKTLEAQLQVCLQKFPRDGVKKVVQQMEKHRVMYEETALLALQQATLEKAEALSQAETLQEALITAKAEALRWQSLYEELRMRSGQLRESQHLSDEQLQQLHSQVEMSRSIEVKLREEVASLRQEKQDLQYNMCVMEEDNQTLREEIQLLREGGDGSQDLLQEFLRSEEAEPQATASRDGRLGEQLRHTQEKLQLKEKECEELQTELHTMEQECQSSQARLAQCRDELRQLSHRRRRPTSCGSWWKVCVFLLLILAVAGVAMLWLWHPPFREQIEDLYSDVETRIEAYLMEMASPQNSGCFRPI
ncbi:unnamed protein product [Menidia menidia]|uniref:(Atlantic silverside) hypothetical protein n=1 Tax=Menidia menidia TaxID=238744 RepID=A0A8S4BY37_9TELE|nr:unnamed protein product [Menidia menidia]